MAYIDDATASEALKQSAHKVAVTPADHVAADQAHYVRLMTAGAKWAVRNGSFQALELMGVSPLPQPPNGYLG